MKGADNIVEALLRAPIDNESEILE